MASSKGAIVRPDADGMDAGFGMSQLVDAALWLMQLPGPARCRTGGDQPGERATPPVGSRMPLVTVRRGSGRATCMRGFAPFPTRPNGRCSPPAHGERTSAVPPVYRRNAALIELDHCV